jgi:hypothetical protein
MGGTVSKVAAWAAALVMAWILALAAAAHATTLTYTAPCTLMHQWRAWDEEKQDSVTNRDCTPGDSAREAITISLWWRPISPGSTFRIVAQHTVPPCREDSFPGQGPGHYYVTGKNSAGPALCGSGQVTILPGVMTGTEVVELYASVVAAALYDVQGRRVAVVSTAEWDAIRGRGWIIDGAKYRALASGIYWLRGVTKAGSTYRRRVVLVR